MTPAAQPSTEAPEAEATPVERRSRHEPGYREMGDRLRAERRAHGLSLRELADRLGVSPSLISQVETGRAQPSVSTLYAIAAELRVTATVVRVARHRALGRLRDCVGLPRARTS